MVCQSRLISTCINRTAIRRKAAAPCPFCMIAAASDFDPHYQDFLFQIADRGIYYFFSCSPSLNASPTLSVTL